MLRDQFIKDYKRRDDLAQATSRALALGNDITAYGHNVQFVEDTITTYTNIPAMTPQRAVYTTEQALCNSGLCDVTWKPLARPSSVDSPKIIIRKRLSDTFVHSLQNRVVFWECYAKLRASGMSRRQIIDTIRG